MTYEFEDEPEDAWSPGDRLDLLLLNLDRRLHLLGEFSAVPAQASYEDRLQGILERLQAWRKRQPVVGPRERDRQRAEDLARHVHWCYLRLQSGG